MKTAKTARRAAAIIIALSLLGVAVYYALRPRPVAVDAATVTKGVFQEWVETEAKTRVRNRYVISAPVSGQLSRIALDEGDRVVSGQIVAHIDPLPLNVAVREAEARLTELRAQRAGVETLRPKTESVMQARARLRAADAAATSAHARAAAASASAVQAGRDAKRAAELHKNGYLPTADLEAAQVKAATLARASEAAVMDENAAKAQVRADQAAIDELLQKQADPDYLIRVYDAQISGVGQQLRRLRADAARTEVRVPAGGTVLRVLQESAQYVAAGAPLLEVGDVSSLEIVADALSADAVRIRSGQDMLVERGADRILRARVHAIEPSGFTKVSPLGIEEQRVNVIGWFVDTPTAIGDAYRLDVRIITWQAPNATIIPLGAVFRCGEDWCTFVVRNGRAVTRTIRLGHRNDTTAEVSSGVRAGDRVVMYPPDTLRDGGRLTLFH